MTLTIEPGWPGIVLAALCVFLLLWYASLPATRRKAVRQLVSELAQLVSAWRHQR